MVKEVSMKGTILLFIVWFSILGFMGYYGFKTLQKVEQAAKNYSEFVLEGK